MKILTPVFLALLVTRLLPADINAGSCEWLNRYYYESYCANIKVETKDGEETTVHDTQIRVRQGICAGEMVCKDKWSYEEFSIKNGNEAKWMEPGVYPLNCAAKITGDTSFDQSCEEVAVKDCLTEHLKNLEIVVESTFGRNI